jgi:hypothetical protein
MRFSSNMDPDPDDVAYRKSVRNTVKVLAVVVAVIAAALILTAYLDVAPDTFQTSTSVASTYPFTMSLAINTTSAQAADGIAITAWLNGTSPGSSVDNVTAASGWAFDETQLVWPRCQQGFPLGVGVMQGHYTQDNYTLGTLLPVHQSLPPCRASSPPAWFYFPSQESRVVVFFDGNLTYWNLDVSMTFGPASAGVSRLAPGVYTAVAADEWGDIALTNFRVS